METSVHRFRKKRVGQESVRKQANSARRVPPRTTFSRPFVDIVVRLGVFRTFRRRVATQRRERFSDHAHSFDEDRYVFYTWRELETPDVFAGVKLSIGKDAVDKELNARRRRKKAQAKR